MTRDGDLLVSMFGRQAHAREPECEWVSVGGLSKWIAFEEIFALRPDLLDRYEAFFFPDDDLPMTPADIDRLFAITMTEGLALAQPALDAAGVTRPAP